jgi:glycosyltransferase involved in cell wall biosynthesis
MHVCHFCETSVGGFYFRNIAKGLTEKGVTVSLLELGPHNPPEWLSEIDGVKYFNLGVTRKWQYPLAVMRLARLLRREKIDILHSHLFYAGLIAVLVKGVTRRRIVALMRHHTSVVRMLGSRAHVALDRWMSERADHVVTVSEAAKKYMVETDRIRRDDIDVVYLGFDFEMFSPDEAARKRVRDEFGFAPNELVIGYIANFAPGKGHAQLVEAFSKILSESPSAKLFLVGRGDDSEARAAVARYGVAERLTFAGWRTDVAACLNATDIFVQPSLSEAFSQVLIEAMGVGLPVIATNVGGAGEVVTEGQTGILIEPDRPEAISESILDLYNNPEKRRAIAEAGMSLVRQRFTAIHMVDRQYELYEKWLGK